MPQQPFEPTAPDRRPQHGAGADQRTPVEGAWAQLPSGEWARTTPHPRSESREEWAARLPDLPGWAQETTGRHRRPESLADSTRLRPATERASGHSRAAEGHFELGEYQDSFIERGYPDENRAAGRTEVGTDHRANIERETQSVGRRRAAEPEAAERTQPGVRQSGRRRTIRRTAADKPEKGRGRRAAAPEAAEYSRDLTSHESDTGSHRRAAVDEMLDYDRRVAGDAGAQPTRRPSGGRGKHAARAEDRAITVRGLPVVQNEGDEEGPGAERTREPIREWALYTAPKPGATGTHRAPGTLPIESWLLVGKKRQQILLGTLVAAGLALVTIPIQQHASINPITTANHLIAQGGGSAHRPTVNDPVKPGTGPRQATAKPTTQPPSQPAEPQPPTANPPAATTAPAEAPLVPVPPGSGPAHSLRVTGSDAISLTFDDGPDPVQTPKILAMLDKYQIKATFCLIGTHVEKHPEIVREIVAAGHTLCNHTWNHSLTIGTESPAAIQADLDRTTAAIHAAAPNAPIPFFRAPGGNFTDRLVSVAYQEGMTSLYWQVDPRDWDHTTDADDLSHTDRVIANVQKFVKPGSIILSHDFNQPDTIVAYEKLMPWLKANFEIGLPVAPPMAPATSEPAKVESTDAAESSQPSLPE